MQCGSRSSSCGECNAGGRGLLHPSRHSMHRCQTCPAFMHLMPRKDRTAQSASPGNVQRVWCRTTFIAPCGVQIVCGVEMFRLREYALQLLCNKQRHAYCSSYRLRGVRACLSVSLISLRHTATYHHQEVDRLTISSCHTFTRTNEQQIIDTQRMSKCR